MYISEQSLSYCIMILKSRDCQQILHFGLVVRIVQDIDHVLARVGQFQTSRLSHTEEHEAIVMVKLRGVAHRLSTFGRIRSGVQHDVSKTRMETAFVLRFANSLLDSFMKYEMPRLNQ